MGPILMTEDGKKPGIEGTSHPDPLSATGMFLNAFHTQPDQPVEQERESAGEWFAAEDKSGAALGGAKLGGAKLGGAVLGNAWGQPLNAPSVPSSAPRPSLGEGKPVPGEFTQMFHKLEFAPSPPVSSAPEARPSPEIARQEPGEFTRMFVRATASMPQRPMPAGSDPAAFPPPATPRLKGFSTPGVSDSASAEGSFTQLFQTAAPAPPVRPFTPLSNGTEAAWSSNLDSPPSKDAMESAGVTQLFRALSPENEPPANRFGEQSPQPAVPASSAPGSITMLIQRLTEDLQSSAASSPPPAMGPDAAVASEPGEFTRIMSRGSASAPAGQGGSAAKIAVPAQAAFPVPAAPLPPAPAFSAPAVSVVAVPKFQTPPIPAPQVVASADPPQSKLQQMMPMLLVLNAFLLVVLIVLVVFLLKSR
jgi:hypothetical protein